MSWRGGPWAHALATAIGLALLIGAVDGPAAWAEGVGPGAPPSGGASNRAQQALDALGNAEQKAAEYLFEEALASSQEALDQGELSRSAHARARWVQALSLAALNRPEAAREAFVRALAVDPSRSIDANLGPRIRTPYYEARSFWKKQGEAPGLRVSFVESKSERIVRVSLVDPLEMAARLELGQRVPPDLELTTRAARAADAPVSIRALAEDGPIEVYARAVDGRGNVVFEVGTHERPLRATARLGAVDPPRPTPHHPSTPIAARAPEASQTPGTPPPATVLSSPVFWIVTGVVVTAAAVAIPVALTQ